MKLLFIEIRLLICEWLLWQVFKLSPKGTTDGDRLKMIVMHYLISKTKK